MAAWAQPLSTRYQQVLLPSFWKFTAVDSAIFSQPGYKDQHWTERQTGIYWKDVRNRHWWGHVRFTLPAKPVATTTDSVLIDLGAIDDADICYLNGKKIGHAGSMPPKFISAWNVPRMYKVHLNDTCLKWGRENLLALQAYNQGSVGGIISAFQRVLVPKAYGALCLQLPDEVRVLGSTPNSRRERQNLTISNSSADTLKGTVVLELYTTDLNKGQSMRLVQSLSIPARGHIGISTQIPTNTPGRWQVVAKFTGTTLGVEWSDTGTVALVVPAQVPALRALVPTTLSSPDTDAPNTCDTLDAFWLAQKAQAKIGAITLQGALQFWNHHQSYALEAPGVPSTTDLLTAGMHNALSNRDSILLWFAAYKLLARQHTDGSLDGDRWPLSGVSTLTLIHYAELAQVAWQLYEQTGYAPWRELCLNLCAYYNSSYGLAPRQKKLNALPKEEVLAMAEWILPAAKLAALDAKPKLSTYNNMALELVRNLDEGNGPRIIGTTLANGSLLPYFKAQPHALLRCLRGLWAVGKLNNRTIWQAAVKKAYSDIESFLKSRQEMASTSPEFWDSHVVIQEWILLSEDLGLSTASRGKHCTLLKQPYVKHWYGLSTKGQTRQSEPYTLELLLGK